MAYVPPHKRHSKDSPKPAPVPSSMITRFNQALTIGGSQPNSRRRQDRQPSSNQGARIVYSTNSISRWFAAGVAGDDPIPPSVRLEPFDCELFERRDGAKPLVLKGGEGGEVEESPWVKIADRFVADLIDCYQNAIEGLESESEVTKHRVVARTGKVLFLGNSVGLESIKKAADSETDSRKQVSKSFYTNVTSAYMEEICDLVAPKIGFVFDSEKENYHVKVFDKSQPDSTISCKCTVSSDGKGLEIYKIELNPVRHLVVDISCLYKDLDLRLMLVTKRTIKILEDEETDGIRKLIESAVIDPDVKGGLRWPLGKESVAERFRIVGVWHTKFKAFKSQTARIRLRHADRFDHRTSTGEVSSEVALKLTGISKHLTGGNADQGNVKEMVQEAVKMIWDHFLTYNRVLG